MAETCLIGEITSIMDSVVLTQEIMITLAVMGVAIMMFISNIVRVDVVGIIMVVALPLLNIIET